MTQTVRTPTNKFLIREPDRRIPRVLISVLLLALVMLFVLSIIGWPRLRSTSIHYDLTRLRAEVQELQQHEHRLEVALECERAPARLAEQAAALGLVSGSRLPAPSVAGGKEPGQ
jgi:hypothetical protein